MEKKYKFDFDFEKNTCEVTSEGLTIIDIVALMKVSNHVLIKLLNEINDEVDINRDYFGLNDEDDDDEDDDDNDDDDDFFGQGGDIDD